MLYLVATPLGNLGDITLRALQVLKGVDLILCEDTRVSGPLLKHYAIDTPLSSYHQYIEQRKQGKIVQMLSEGKTLALISDAGTPVISDPGAKLVAHCRERGLNVTAVPGPCAPIAALIQSGLPTERFQFIGFLPKSAGQRKQQLCDALFYPGVTLFFESPHRMGKTLEELALYAPDHRVAIIREMTKMYEQCLLGPAKTLPQIRFRGEIVVALEGGAKLASDLPPQEQIKRLMDTYDLSKHEAIKLSAQLQGVPKKNLYSSLIADGKRSSPAAARAARS